jgi:hypothetical protein
MKFEDLTGKRALGIAHVKDYADWAESLLCDGVDSQNAAILVGLGLNQYPDSEEVEKYFQRCLKELGLHIPSNEECIKYYAKYLCEQILAGGVEPENGLSLLESLFFPSDYAPIYSIWDELSDDVWRVKHNEGAIFNSGLTEENVPDYIRNVAAQFLKLIEVKLPNNFFRMSLCPKCCFFGEPKSERIEKPWLPDKLYRLIFRRGPVYRSICGECGERVLAKMWDYEGRGQYLHLSYNKR